MTLKEIHIPDFQFALLKTGDLSVLVFPTNQVQLGEDAFELDDAIIEEFDTQLSENMVEEDDDGFFEVPDHFAESFTDCPYGSQGDKVIIVNSENQDERLEFNIETLSLIELSKLTDFEKAQYGCISYGPYSEFRGYYHHADRERFRTFRDMDKAFNDVFFSLNNVDENLRCDTSKLLVWRIDLKAENFVSFDNFLNYIRKMVHRDVSSGQTIREFVFQFDDFSDTDLALVARDIARLGHGVRTKYIQICDIAAKSKTDKFPPEPKLQTQIEISISYVLPETKPN